MKCLSFRPLCRLAVPACLVFSLSWAAARALDRSQKLNGPLDYVNVTGDVLSFRVSADGRWVLYTAQEDDPVPGLYAVRSDRSQGPILLSQPGATVGDFQLGPIGPPFVFLEGTDLIRVRPDGVRLQLNPPLVSGGSVTGFQLASNGLRVVYRADQDVDEVFQLHSVRIDGTHPVLLTPGTVAGGDVFNFRLSSSGTFAVYQGNTQAAGLVELFRVSVNGGGSPEPLCGPFVANGDVFVSTAAAPTYGFSAGDSHLLYLADQEVNNRLDLFSVPLDQSSAPVRINVPLIAAGDVRSFHTSAHGSRVVYRVDQEVDEVIEVYSAPIDGSLPPVKLNGTEKQVDSALVSLDGTQVAFVASPNGNGYAQVYGVPSDGSLAAVQLSSLPTGGFHDPVPNYLIAPDSDWVLYRGEGPSGGATRLWRVPIDGSSAPAAVNAAGEAPAFALTPDGSRVVYLADETIPGTYELRAQPLDGSSPPALLHPAFVEGTQAEIDFAVLDDLVVYRSDEIVFETTELHSVPLDASALPLLLNGPLLSTPFTTDVLSFALSPDGETAAYATAAGVSGISLSAPGDAYSLSLPGPPSSAYDKLRVTPDSSRVVFRGPRFGMQVFSAPTDGSAPCAQLTSGQSAEPFGAANYVLSPDGEHLVFYTSSYFFSSFLARVRLDGGGSPVFLAGDAGPVGFTPDGSHVVYVTFNNPKNPAPDSNRLYVRAADGSSPAVELAPSTPFAEVGGVADAQMTADGSSVVYTCDQEEAGKRELYRVPVDDSAPPTKLSGTLGSNRDVTRGFVLTPDGMRVVYAADRDADQVVELYVAPLDGSAAPLELSGPMVTGGDVRLTTVSGSSNSGAPLVQIAPDSSRLVYVADQDQDERFELYVVPLDASLPPAKVNAPLVSGGDVSLDPAGVGISPDGTRVLYLADQLVNDRIELYSAPIDGGGPVVALSGALVPGGNVDVFAFLPSSKGVLFRADRAQNDVFELWFAPLTGGWPPARVSFLAHAAGDVQADFQVSSDGSHVFYRADAHEDEVQEFFRFPLPRAPHVKPR